MNYFIKSIQTIVVLDFLPSTEIGAACREAIAFSDAQNVHVNFVFNGVLMAVWPGRTFEDMMTFWNTKIGPK